MTLEEEMAAYDAGLADEMSAYDMEQGIETPSAGTPTAPVETDADYAPGGQFAAPVIDENTEVAQPKGVTDYLGDIANAPSEVGQEFAKFLAYPMMQGKENAPDAGQAIRDTLATVGEGAAATALGVIKSGADLVGLLPNVDTSEFLDDELSVLNTAIEDYKTKYKVDGITAEDFGRFLPSLATLGASTSSKLIVPIIEGLLVTGEQRGAGAKAGEAFMTGALTAAGTAGLGLILDSILPPTKKALLKYLQEEHDISDTAADQMLLRYKTLMKADDSADSRIKAIIDQLGGAEGYTLKHAATELGPKAAKSIRLESLGRKKLMRDLVKSSQGLVGRASVDQLSAFSKTLQTAQKGLQDSYTSMKALMPETPIKNTFVTNALDITSTLKTLDGDFVSASAKETAGGITKVRTENAKGIAETLTEKTKTKLSVPELEEAKTATGFLKQLLTSDELTPKTLVEAIRLSKDISPNLDAIGKASMKNLSNDLENVLKANISKEQYSLFKKNKSDYSQMLGLKDHYIGKSLNNIYDKKLNPKGTQTAGEVMEELRAINHSSEGVLNSIYKVAGGSAEEKFEQSLITDMLEENVKGGSSTFVSFGELNDVIKNKGFISKYGQNFQKLTDIASKSFATDDTIKAALYKTPHATLERLASVQGQGKMWLVGRIWPHIEKRFPTEAAKHARYGDALKAIMSKPTFAKTAQEVLEELPEYEKQLIRADLSQSVKEFLSTDAAKMGFARSVGTAGAATVEATPSIGQ